MSMMKNCLLVGVGGQGTVLASRLIAQAAIDRGTFARTAETIGMAQRGGCVVSHVRLGANVSSPLIPKGEADLILGFEPGEAVRSLEYLRLGGAVVAAKKAVQPVTATLETTCNGLAPNDYGAEEMITYLRKKVEHLIILDGAMICATCGSSKVLNTALLGAAIGGNVLGISLAEMRRTIRTRVPERFVEINLKALEMGAELASNK